MSSSGKARERGIVVRYSDEKDCEPPDLHEAVSRIQIAKKLAALKGYDFADNYESAKDYLGHVYFVPDHTLSDTESVRRLGIHNEHDLFGGVVPHAFVATKTITHPLVDRNAMAPEGWHGELGHDLRDAVLFGFSAFRTEDAQRAGRLVLQRAQARIKPARGIGGRGQSVVSTTAELDRVIGGLDSQELSRHGIVIEQISPRS